MDSECVNGKIYTIDTKIGGDEVVVVGVGCQGGLLSQ